MFRRTTLFALLLLIVASLAQADGTAIDSDEKKTLYALGLALSGRLQPYGFSEAEVAMVQRGLADGVLGREPAVELTEYGPQIDPYLQERVASLAGRERAASAEFLEQAAAKEGAEQTDSGLVYFELEPGSGDGPLRSSTVRFHYKGALRDGTVFDETQPGEPAEFAVVGVIPCMTEGLLRMQPGGKSRLVCPPDIAYGDQGAPPMILPGATLTFDLELVEILPEDDSGSEPTP